MNLFTGGLCVVVFIILMLSADGLISWGSDVWYPVRDLDKMESCLIDCCCGCCPWEPCFVLASRSLMTPLRMLSLA